MINTVWYKQLVLIFQHGSTSHYKKTHSKCVHMCVLVGMTIFIYFNILNCEYEA